MKRILTRRCRTAATRAAFSLVELAIAIGISAFAILAIIGLMPGGLSTLRDSGEATLRAQIFHNLQSQISFVAFDKLSDFAAQGPFYFDTDGNSSAQESLALYSANVTQGDPSFPGSREETSKSLTTMTIELVDLRSKTTFVHTAYVSNTDQSASN